MYQVKAAALSGGGFFASAALRCLLVAGRCCGLGRWAVLIFRQFLHYFTVSVDFSSPFALYSI